VITFKDKTKKTKFKIDDEGNIINLEEKTEEEKEKEDEDIQRKRNRRTKPGTKKGRDSRVPGVQVNVVREDKNIQD